MLTYHEKIVEEKIDQRSGSPYLYLSIKDLLSKEIINDVEKLSPTLKNLTSNLKKKTSIIKMNKRESFQFVSGADAGSQTLPLAFKRYFVISALVYSMPFGFRFHLEPELLSMPYSTTNDGFRRKINLLRETKLFETAYKFIVNGARTELLLIDGPLLFGNTFDVTIFKEYKKLIDAVNRLLKICKEKNILIAGIVKRPIARYFIRQEGLIDETDVSDSFLLLHLLEPGERTDIFSFKTPIDNDKRKFFFGSIEYPIYSFYGRFSKEWSVPSIRVDLPAFNLAYLNDIADYCYSFSYRNGIPLPIVRADEEVRISKRFISGIYNGILRKVGIKFGDLKNLAPFWGEEKWMII